MGLSSSPSQNGTKYNDQLIAECTCGRNRYNDKEELAVIAEQDGFTPKGTPCKTSLVVCLRDGCDGRWRTNRPYMQGLKRILWSEYKGR